MRVLHQGGPQPDAAVSKQPQLGAVDGMQGNPAAAKNVKLGMRALALILVPITASFPQVRCRQRYARVKGLATDPLSAQGVFVYWITSNTYSFFQAVGAFGAPFPLCAFFRLDLWIHTQCSSGSRFAMRWESPTPRTSRRRGLAYLTARKCHLAHFTLTSRGRGSDKLARMLWYSRHYTYAG